MEERLKKFVRLVDYGTFTAAAQKLHTSQPALTASIQKLERELHAELLLRGSRAVTPTTAGLVAYEQGRMLLAAEHNLRARLAALQSRKQPFRLGCIDSVAERLVNEQLLDKLEENAEVSLQVQNSTVLLLQLQQGELDVALVVEQSSVIKTFVSQPLGRERFALVCTEDYRRQNRAAIRAKELPNLLSYNQGSTTQKLVSTQLQANGFNVTPRFYSTNPDVLLQLALQGKGVAALPTSMIATDNSRALVEIKLRKPIQRSIVLVRERGRKLPDFVPDFIAELPKILV